MRVYLAGPMSSMPQMNFPAFYTAAVRLRELGWDVVSPAELDDEQDAAIALRSETHPTKTWGDFLARDVKIIADGGIEGIVFLPRWWQSRGARLEATIGLLQGPRFAFYQYVDRGVQTLSREQVAFRVYEAAL